MGIWANGNFLISMKIFLPLGIWMEFTQMCSSWLNINVNSPLTSQSLWNFIFTIIDSYLIALFSSWRCAVNIWNFLSWLQTNETVDGCSWLFSKLRTFSVFIFPSVDEIFVSNLTIYSWFMTQLRFIFMHKIWLTSTYIFRRLRGNMQCTEYDIK